MNVKTVPTRATVAKTRKSTTDAPVISRQMNAAIPATATNVSTYMQFSKTSLRSALPENDLQRTDPDEE